MTSSGPGPGQGPFSTLIAAAFAHLPPDRFAVLDGALYDDLPATLARSGVRAQPLFLEAGNAGAVASGPFLAPLDTPEQIAALTALVAGHRLPVIWSWARGQAALYRHLRTINIADVPIERDIDEDADDPEWDGQRAPSRRTVVFRHWDSDVLVKVQPLLDPGQSARLLGASAGVSYLPFHSTGDAAVSWLMPTDSTPPATGVISFSADQFAALSNSRLLESRRNIMTYLRETAAEDLEGVADPELYAMVVEAEVAGNVIGLKSEHAHGLWAFLHVITGGESSQSRDIRQHFYKAAEDPEIVLKQVLDDVMAELD